MSATPFDAVNAPLRDVTLIEASAGAGKTTTITKLFVRLLIEEELPVESVLVVTYTRAATAELRDRVRRQVALTLAAFETGEAGKDADLACLLERREGQRPADIERLRAALRDFDRAPIFTIHGFCQRVLVEGAFESQTPFDVELLDDLTPLLLDVVDDCWVREMHAVSAPLVERMKTRRGPDALARLAQRLTQWPGLAVVPERGPAPPPLDDEPLARAHRDAAALWSKHRADVIALLTRGDLNGQKYKKAKIREEWPATLDAYFSGDPWPPHAGLGKLGSQALAAATNKTGTTPQHPFFDACDVLWGEVERVHGELDAHVLATTHRAIDYLGSELGRRKLELGVQGFDDLLHRLGSALAGSAAERLADRIGARIKAVLIDEFQDTDAVQYDVFRRLRERTGLSLFLVGDPKQAIYGFRGADVFAYLRAVKLAGERHHTLGTSYRSDPSLVRAVNEVFENRQRLPFLFEGIGFERLDAARDERIRGRDAPPAALTVLFAPQQDCARAGWGNRVLPGQVASEIVRLLGADVEVDGEDIAPRHVAVLCRTNKQARAVQRELRRLGVPTVLDGDSSVFATETAEELSRVLDALAHPSDARRVRAALATSLFGLDAHALSTLEEGSDLDERLEAFARWGQLWHERGFVQAFHRMLDDADVRERLLARADGERRLTDLLHLGELLHAAATREHLEPLALWRWLGEMRRGDDKRRGMSAESAQLRIEHDVHAVHLTTVHRSKGLEYPIVFCPFLWKGPWTGGKQEDPLFHDPQRDDRATLDIGSAALKEHKVRALLEEVAESLRLLYVALTRAKHRCFVVWGHSSNGAQSPLAYALHPPPEPGATTEQAFAEAKDRWKGLSDAKMREQLHALCERSEGAIGVRDLATDRPQPLGLLAPPPDELKARHSERDLRSGYRTTSFTALSVVAEDDREEARDHDEPSELAPLAEGGTSSEQPEATPVVLADFPAGARPGTLLHGIYESIDFTRADPDELQRQVREWLGRFRYDVEQWAEPVARAIDASLTTPLDASGLTLSRIAPADRLVEMEFTLPVAGHGTRLRPADLAAVFARHGAPGTIPDYHERLRTLGFAALEGFLRGFVDLVFRYEGRFYLVDYKSNRLGSDASAYAPFRLVEAMRHHHYPLQYHLYLLALHRHLRRTLPDYDPARHLGGVYYLFVRGMAPEHPLGTGVFHDQPKPELIEALSALFDDPGAVR